MPTSLARPSLASPALIALSLFAVACTTQVIGGGSGGSGGEPTSSSSSSGSTSSSSSSGSTSSGTPGACADPTVVGLPPSACKPVSPSCEANASLCLATAHAHGGPAFGLRIAHITLSAPKALTKGIVKSVFEGAVSPKQPDCGLQTGGTFNWLMRFDTQTGTLTTGAARPLTAPAQPYAFVNETLTLDGVSFPVAPVTVSASLDASCNVASSAGNVILPFYENEQAQSFTLFPLRSLSFFDTRLTPDHDCIGSYNAAGLDPANGCTPDEVTPQFLDAGSFAAFISLEEADTVQIPLLSQSLCVLLSGDPGSYGDAGKCLRDAGNEIVWKGDWCSTTNQPATPGCADAMRFAGSFAASGVGIN